jgi:LeuA allosteric (dimerisation) domain.
MTEIHEDSLQLSRWTATSGSNVRSRGAVVITSGDHEWRASADGNGAIDALYRAVDNALVGVLSGHPRLLAYDIHALGEGTDTIGAVTVRIAPPDIGGERGSGEYTGEARGPNIIAASIEAYILALNALLGESHWSGATEAAGNRKGVAISPGKAREQRADIDEAEVPRDTTAWFER